MSIGEETLAAEPGERRRVYALQAGCGHPIEIEHRGSEKEAKRLIALIEGPGGKCLACFQLD